MFRTAPGCISMPFEFCLISVVIKSSGKKTKQNPTVFVLVEIATRMCHTGLLKKDKNTISCPKKRWDRNKYELSQAVCDCCVCMNCVCVWCEWRAVVEGAARWTESCSTLRVFTFTNTLDVQFVGQSSTCTSTNDNPLVSSGNSSDVFSTLRQHLLFLCSVMSIILRFESFQIFGLLELLNCVEETCTVYWVTRWISEQQAPILKRTRLTRETGRIMARVKFTKMLKTWCHSWVDKALETWQSVGSGWGGQCKSYDAWTEKQYVHESLPANTLPFSTYCTFIIDSLSVPGEPLSVHAHHRNPNTSLFRWVQQSLFSVMPPRPWSLSLSGSNGSLQLLIWVSRTAIRH